MTCDVTEQRDRLLASLRAVVDDFPFPEKRRDGRTVLWCPYCGTTSDENHESDCAIDIALNLIKEIDDAIHF